MSVISRRIDGSPSSSAAASSPVPASSTWKPSSVSASTSVRRTRNSSSTSRMRSSAMRGMSRSPCFARCSLRRRACGANSRPRVEGDRAAARRAPVPQASGSGVAVAPPSHEFGTGTSDAPWMKLVAWSGPRRRRGRLLSLVRASPLMSWTRASEAPPIAPGAATPGSALSRPAFPWIDSYHAAGLSL